MQLDATNHFKSVFNKTIIPTKPVKRFQTLCLGLFAIGLLFRLVASFNRPLWIDEQYTLDSIQYTFQTILQGNINLHPPLYFLFLKVFSIFTQNLIVLRVSSAIISYSSGFIGIYLLGKHFDCSISILLIYVFSPAHILYSSELRMYSFVSSFSGFTLFFLLKQFTRPPLSKHNHTSIIYAFLFLFLAMSTHYFSLLLVIPVFITLFILYFFSMHNNFWPKIRGVILWSIPVIAAGILLINNTVFKTLTKVSFSTAIFTIEGHRLIDAILRQNWGTASLLQDGFCSILTLVGFWQLFKKYRTEFYLISLTVILSFLTIPFLPLKHFWHERYFFFLFPFLLLPLATGLHHIASSGWETALNPHYRLAKYIIPLILVVTWYTNALPVMLQNQERWDILKEILSSNADTANDCILFYPKYLSSELYIDPSLHAIPNMKVSRYTIDSLVATDTKRVWLVTGYRENSSRSQQAGWYKGYLAARFRSSQTYYTELSPNDRFPSSPRAISLYLFDKSTPAPQGKRSLIHSN